jgi:hypothetical protein
MSDGMLRAWGRNDSGQSDIPVGLSSIVAISAGTAHNVVLRADGTVVSWGLNTNCQTNVPAGLSNVVAIACGGWHNLALKSNGTVVAWGAGQGTNTYVDWGQNIVPPGLSNVVQVAAGAVNSLALVGTEPPAQGVDVQPGLTNNEFYVDVPTQPGRVYALEFESSLNATLWTAFPLHAGTAGVLRLIDPTPAPGNRFYRVRRW